MEISIPDFYSRFLETQDFMFPTFIQKIATLTENRFGKKILSSIRLDDFSKSRQVFVKFLWIFRASNVLFLCFGKARNNTFSARNTRKTFQTCLDFSKSSISLKNVSNQSCFYFSWLKILNWIALLNWNDIFLRT